MLQNYILRFQKSTLMSTRHFQMLKREFILHDPTNLFLETYNYGNWLENEKSTDKTESW